MAFERISSLLEADFTGTGPRAIRCVNTSQYYYVLKIRDNLGIVRRRDEFPPNETVSVNLPPGIRTVALQESVTEDGVTFNIITLPLGWKLTGYHLVDGRLPEALP
jgi:hypothetical protein